ncbi:3-hydroxyacyl-CoA dehydrogenase family protein [Pontibacter sp. SGAir0037]|uniref:3-hydroxyacyl-CoA dehydrogenase family protein n=1 Tax=Pontibacter sp. SGAir0037 TaxID=2571030 RepID=UPI0010CD487C|nr:3-hydroxyacyl-CoA dehydrogenase family protein [Pontibacter sp. SGAir0037]QCR24050.1 3-hydroxyacyl-CoA dehydrogenase [Pontibacter sp. SGAir0037]
MQVIILSGPDMAAAFKLKFPEENSGNSYTFLLPDDASDALLQKPDVVFDFLLHEQPGRLMKYRKEQVVFCNVVTTQLAALARMVNLEHSCTLIGFNGLPTLLNRDVLEVSLLKPADEAILSHICKALGTAYLLVDDRVGMVTPRILCMIINEACYTLQEGTASVSAIDSGMKLGTNYPKGPFEWANQIGVKNVYEVLQAVYEDTKDERYKICPLLKTMYLKGEQFSIV